MSKNLRDQLVERTKKAEKEIKKVLQSFHDETGMIPVGVDFHSTDISTYDTEIRKSVQISSVDLKANT